MCWFVVVKQLVASMLGVLLEDLVLWIMGYCVSTLSAFFRMKTSNYWGLVYLVSEINISC